VIVSAKDDIEICASDNVKDARCVVIGGAPLGDREKYWNFVSSRSQRIEQAKSDWKNKQFPSVPNETEFIPLP